MPSVYELKSKFQNLLRPLVRMLHSIGITANQVTIFAIFISLATGLALYFIDSVLIYSIVPVALFIRMALNAIDGMLAREFKQASKTGAILNELGDVFSDIFIYFPFAYIPGAEPSLVALFLFTAIIGEMTGVISVQIGASRRYDGPMGKSDRAFVFSILSIVLAFGISPQRWFDLTFLVLLVLSLYTILNRAVKALKEVKEGS
ncbi:MAG: CDP-alcohol phosphatidyltransferase family protein [Leptospirales bacterium]